MRTLSKQNLIGDNREAIWRLCKRSAQSDFFAEGLIFYYVRQEAEEKLCTAMLMQIFY